MPFEVLEIQNVRIRGKLPFFKLQDKSKSITNVSVKWRSATMGPKWRRKETTRLETLGQRRRRGEGIKVGNWRTKSRKSVKDFDGEVQGAKNSGAIEGVATGGVENREK